MADIELDNLIIRDFKTSSGFQAVVASGEIGENDISLTPFMPANLWIFFPAWSDHEVDDMSWLRADTFSWHPSEPYRAGYEKLVNAITGAEQKTDTIGDITITYYQKGRGVKVCLPDQESNLVALYETTGIAWYYLLDTENKQFKLPRTKWGFTGLRDSVGGYVEPGLPSIEHTHSYEIGSATDSPYTYTSTQARILQGTRNTSGIVGNVSDIYGKSDTVQSPATQMYLYFYVGNFEQSAVEQTAGLNAEMFNGKADIDDVANLAMPGDRYVDLTLGASNSSYTAPADGYVILGKRVGANTMQFNCLKVVNDSGYISRIESANSVSGLWATVMMPVKKGRVFSVEYSTTGTVAVFRFVYANGAK